MIILSIGMLGLDDIVISSFGFYSYFDINTYINIWIVNMICPE